MSERSQRQLAAILFTDVVGYTAIMAEDESRARQLHVRYRQVLQDHHQKFGGKVVNDLGDGSLSLFPSAVEAVRCSIEMQKHFQQEPQVPLRIGIHFGEVVQDEVSLYGTAVNIASRLESLGVPGSILVSDRLRRELTNQTDLSFQSLGMFELKNVPDPMEVFAVANDDMIVPKPSEIQGKGQRLSFFTNRAPTKIAHFVGREKELEELNHAWRKAQAGGGAVIGIVGEPGIGKTTLVEEFLYRLEKNGETLLVARGRCSEHLAGSEAYLPILELLEGLTQKKNLSLILKQLAPSWYVQLFPYSIEESRTLELAAQSSQERRKREIRAFFEKISFQSPLILFIEDLHWSDPSTTDLLSYLAPLFSSLRILCIINYRLVDLKLAGHSYLGIRTEWIGKGRLREFDLSNLGKAEIRQYLDKTFPRNRFDNDFMELLLDHTAGNPLFMVDLIKHLQTQDALIEDDGWWKSSDHLTELQIPDSIQGMIRNKLERLDLKDHQILTVAAIQGFEFDGEVLANVMEADPMQLSNRLIALEEEHHLLKYQGDRIFPNGSSCEHYQFVHALYQNVLFEKTRTPHRKHWSKLIAQNLTELYGDRLNESAVDLARLYQLANDPVRAAEFLLRAAQHALSKTGYEEVLVLVEKGLELIQNTPEFPHRDNLHLEFLLSLGPALMVLKGFGSKELGENYHTAQNLCRSSGDTWKVFKALNGLWLFAFNTADMYFALDLAYGMQEIAKGETNSKYQVVADHALADTSLFMGNLHEAKVYYDRLINSYDFRLHGELSFELSIEDPGIGAYGVGCLGLAHMGLPDQARKWCEHGIKLGHKLPDTFSFTIALLCGQTMYHSLHDVVQVQKFAEKAVGLSVDTQNPLVEGISKIFLGWVKAMQNPSQSAIELVETGLKLYETTGSHLFHFLRTPIIESYLAAGQFEACHMEIEKALNLGRQFNTLLGFPEIHRLKGVCVKKQGLPDAMTIAEECFLKSIDIAQSQNARLLELRAIISLAQLWREQGRYGEAYQKLQTIYNRFAEGFDSPILQQAQSMLDDLDKIN